MNSSTIENFEVKLQDVNKVFCPGDTIYGQVNLTVKEDLKIKEMRLECRGEAYVNWSENSGSYTRYHYNRERYFNAIEVIFGKGMLFYFPYFCDLSFGGGQIILP